MACELDFESCGLSPGTGWSAAYFAPGKDRGLSSRPGPCPDPQPFSLSKLPLLVTRVDTRMTRIGAHIPGVWAYSRR
jgi:hypothetical protein